MSSDGESAEAFRLRLKEEILSGAYRRLPFAMPANVRSLLDRLWLCREERYRLDRAFDRARPVDRLYARVRRIVLMLDLAWEARDGEPRADIQARIESLMTWHPTLKKGMRLPAPDPALYRAALERLLSSAGSPGSDVADRLRNLPEAPDDWDRPYATVATVREVGANIQACSRLVQLFIVQALELLDPGRWQWFEKLGGAFKVLACADGWLSLGNPDTGGTRCADILWAVHEQSGRPVTDPGRIDELERRCTVKLPVSPTPGLRWHLANASLSGAWVAWPLFGRVTEVTPPRQPWIHAPAYAYIPEVGIDGPFRPSASRSSPYWLVIATKSEAEDPKRLAALFGRYLREAESAGTHPDGRDYLRRDWFGRNRDRLQALWLKLKLDAVLWRCERGKPVHPGSLHTLFRCKTETRLRMAIYGHMLGRIRLEAASRGETSEAELASMLLSATRQAFAEPDAWARAGDTRRIEVTRAYASHDFGWVRVHVHATRQRTRNRKLLLLEHIASDAFIQAIVLFLFDYIDYRYRWSTGSPERLRGLAGLLDRYVSNRDAPNGSGPRRARGNVLSLIDAFMISSVAMEAQARTLGLQSVEIDLLMGEVMTPGFDAYRHRHLAEITRDRFASKVSSLLPSRIERALLTLDISRGSPAVSIRMRLGPDKELLIARPG